MQNRGRSEILRDILQSTNGGAGKSEIMYSAYLSHSQLKIYLEEMIRQGLIEYSHLENKQYRTTVKGLEYLKAVDSISNLLRTKPKSG